MKDRGVMPKEEVW